MDLSITSRLEPTLPCFSQPNVPDTRDGAGALNSSSVSSVGCDILPAAVIGGFVDAGIRRSTVLAPPKSATGPTRPQTSLLCRGDRWANGSSSYEHRTPRSSPGPSLDGEGFARPDQRANLGRSKMAHLWRSVWKSGTLRPGRHRDWPFEADGP